MMALRLEPTQVGFEEKITETFVYVRKMCDAIVKKGYVKNKRLQNELASFRFARDDKLMMKLMNYQRVQMNELTEGATNTGKIFFCKILAPVCAGSYLRQSYIALSQNGEVFGLTVYKLGQQLDLIRPFDELGILDPYLMNIQLQYDQAMFQYRSVRVTDPMTLVINGKALPRSNIATVWLDTTVTS